ncbi:hypothetical protein Dimus_012403 [Dionaea muscipula]
MAPSNRRFRNQRYNSTSLIHGEFPWKGEKYVGEGLPSVDQKKKISTENRPKSKGKSKSSSHSADHLRKGAWSALEDAILVDYVKKHGEGDWASVHRKTKLLRCGKSCRLRWVNHLRPNLKRGPFSSEEKSIIFELHAKLGNKWSQIAAHLPGRTDNEIKNFWNALIKNSRRTHLHFNSVELCTQEYYGNTKNDDVDGFTGEEHQNLLQASDDEITDIIVNSVMFHERILSHGNALSNLPASGLDVDFTSFIQYYSLISTTNQWQSGHQQDHFFASRSGYSDSNQNTNSISDEICLSQRASLTHDPSSADTNLDVVKMELPSIQYPETSLTFLDKACPTLEWLSLEDVFPYSPSNGEIQSGTSKKNTGLLDDMIPDFNTSNTSVNISSTKSSVSSAYPPSSGIQISTFDAHDTTVESDWEDCLASPLDPSTASIFHGCTPTILEHTFPDQHIAASAFHGNNIASELVEQIRNTYGVEGEISNWMDMSGPHDLLNASCVYWDAMDGASC